MYIILQTKKDVSLSKEWGELEESSRQLIQKLHVFAVLWRSVHTTKLWGCQVKLRNDSFTRFFLPKMEIGSNFVVLCNFLEQQTGFAQRVYRCFVYCMDHRCFVLGPIHSRYILDDWTRCESCNGSTRFGTGSPRFNDNPKPGWYPISHMFFFLVPTCFHPKFLIQIDHFFQPRCITNLKPSVAHGSRCLCFQSSRCTRCCVANFGRTCSPGWGGKPSHEPLMPMPYSIWLASLGVQFTSSKCIKMLET